MPNSSRESETSLRQACKVVSSRTTSGVRFAAQQVLTEHPELAMLDEAAIEIIYTEYQTLDELGQRPDTQEWLAAYPEHRERLQRLVQLHDLLDESAVIAPARPSSSASVPGGSSASASASASASSASSSASLSASASSASQRQPTDTIGDYELLSELGRGGMGIVYRARQRGLGRLVAVKVLRTTDNSNVERSRFRQEAEAIAMLQHPNIVQVFEVGSDGDRDFLSMELIEGGSLELWTVEQQSSAVPSVAQQSSAVNSSAQQSAASPLSSTASPSPNKSSKLVPKVRSYHEIALLIKQLSDAVGFAHERGIVHRDLKPANVLLTARGEPKVVDFGLAKRLDDAARVHTQTGSVLGTPSYMSPEQASGSGQVGPASDLFSLGVILYQLLTNRLPFDGSSTVETLKQIVECEPTAPTRFGPSIPRDLETICLKCLAKDVAGRYASAAALSEDLGRFLDHLPIQARRAGALERMVRTIKRHREVSLLAAALGLLLVTASGYVAWQQQHLLAAQSQAASQTRLASQQRERANMAEQAYESSLLKARELVGRTTDLGMKLANEPGWDQTRRKAFEDAASYYEEFVKQHAEDPTIRREAAEAAMRSAMLLIDLGRWSDAEARLVNANQWLGELSSDRHAQWLRSDCLLQLAIVNGRLERAGQAEKIFDETIALLRELLASSPDQSSYLLRLANTQTNLCTLIAPQRRFDECIKIYLEAIDNCLHAIRSIMKMDTKPSASEDLSVEELVDRRVGEAVALRSQILSDPKLKSRAGEVPNAFAELALTLDDMSAVLTAKSLQKPAEQVLRESVALRDAYMQMFPDNRWIQHYAARGLSNLGQMLLNTGRPEEALPLLSKADQLFSSLVKDFPDRVHHRREWAFALAAIGRTHLLNQDYAQAIQLTEKAVKIHEQLAASQPGNEWMRQDLVGSLRSLARCYQTAGQKQQAIDQFQRAMEVLPDNAMVCNSFAWMLVRDSAITHEHAQQALELSRKATGMMANSNDYWNTLSLACYRLARTTAETDKQAAYFEEGLKSIARAEEIVGGGTIADWYFHAMNLAGLDRVEEARGWHQRAEARRLAQAPNDVELNQFSQESSAALHRPK